MIVFRQVDARYPFLWEDAQQAPGRWHAAGDGPAHYFADTPDGAWAEFLRHEEITEAEDVLTIRRQLWAVDIGDAPAAAVSLPIGVLTGGPAAYARCQQEARALRAGGAERIVAPSAALVAGGASGFRVHDGTRSAPPRDARVIVVFGSPGDITGWIAAEDARPPVALLDRVRHYPHGAPAA
jgi:RES domain-containing protein